jgi:hypothetical protein
MSGLCARRIVWAATSPLKEKTMDKRIKGLIGACCSFGISLLMAGPAWSVAAQESALPPSATLEELDEIVLNGKRMEQRMLESEQRFYQVYNQLNARKDFNVTCSFWASDPKSSGVGVVRMKQSCVPAFYADAVAEESGNFIRTSASFDSCTRPSTFYLSQTSVLAVGGPLNGQMVSFANVPSSWPDNCYPVAAPRVPSARPYLMWLDRRAAFEENLVKVMRSDPQLQALGGQFQSLIKESGDAQKMATQARKLRVELRLAARKCPVPTSPRNPTKGCKSG